MNTEAYNYWLASLTGLSSRKKILLDEQCGSSRAVYRLSQDRLNRFSFLKPAQVTSILYQRQAWDLELEYKRLKNSGARLVTWRDPDYPYIFSTLADAPYGFFLKGSLPAKGSKSVAIVGSRTCSAYGKKQAETIASTLGKAGINVISGMALGIDGVAQQAAVKSGGYSLAVLGCGIDICYPERHHLLYQDLIKHGGILSEYPLFDPPLRAHFPQRNRLISVLSDALIVIEAREKSGSLITADFALEQGKEVYALPGPADSLLSRGCHRLIEQGAHIMISVEELLKDLGAKAKERNRTYSSETLPGLSEPEQRIMTFLSDTPIKLSELELMTGLNPSVLTSSLVSMQLKGIAREFSLQHYVRA